MKALSKVKAASEASDSVLKEYTLEQHKTMDNDEAKLNLFASAIREWKENLRLLTMISPFCWRN